jgi:lysozyme
MMQLGAAGKALIQSFEQCRLKSYQDGGGIWTLGWGHTGPAVGPESVCTQADADSWFLADVAGACRAVNSTVDVAMTQGQFDALVSFTFNVGAGNEAHSTLIRVLNGGDTAGAADQFLVWNKVNGQVSDGLSRRRAAERALFLGLSS